AVAGACGCHLEDRQGRVGNVPPARGFAGAPFTDFALSAVAAGPALARARRGRVGEAIYRAVAATRRVTSTNTNLGIVLLLAPIVAAAPLPSPRLPPPLPTLPPRPPPAPPPPASPP